MSESLQNLIRRIMREQGIDSVRALYRRLPDTTNRVTYETIRKLANGEQRGTRDARVFRDLAVMLRVDENVIRQAMNVPPTYGVWQLPPRAQSLNPDERSVVMTVVDTILRAKGIDTALADASGSAEPDEAAPAAEAGRAAGPSGNVRHLRAAPADEAASAEPPAWQPGFKKQAARRGRKSAVDGDQDLDENQDQGGSDDPA